MLEPIGKNAYAVCLPNVRPGISIMIRKASGKRDWQVVVINRKRLSDEDYTKQFHGGYETLEDAEAAAQRIAASMSGMPPPPPKAPPTHLTRAMPKRKPARDQVHRRRSRQYGFF